MSTKTLKNAVPVQAASPGSLDHRVKIGLGSALRRHQVLTNRYRSGISTDYENAERLLIEDALDEIKLTINASCVPGEDLNRDGIPDNLEFFELMASGSCDCTVRREPAPASVPAPTKKRRVT